MTNTTPNFLTKQQQNVQTKMTTTPSAPNIHIKHTQGKASECEWRAKMWTKKQINQKSTEGGKAKNLKSNNQKLSYTIKQSNNANQQYQRKRALKISCCWAFNFRGTEVTDGACSELGAGFGWGGGAKDDWGGDWLWAELDL